MTVPSGSFRKQKIMAQSPVSIVPDQNGSAKHHEAKLQYEIIGRGSFGIVLKHRKSGSVIKVFFDKNAAKYEMDNNSTVSALDPDCLYTVYAIGEGTVEHIEVVCPGDWGEDEPCFLQFPYAGFVLATHQKKQMPPSFRLFFPDAVSKQPMNRLTLSCFK